MSRPAQFPSTGGRYRPVDIQSRQLMTWIWNHLDDPGFWEKLTTETRQGLDQFLARPREELEPLLFDKLHAGALEHGAPIYKPEQIEAELEKERLDELGWLLIKWWNQERLDQ